MTDNKGASSEAAPVTITITNSDVNLSKLVINEAEQWLRTPLYIELGAKGSFEIIGSQTSEGALSSDSTNHKIETIENQLHLTPLTGHDEHVRYKVNGNSGVTYYDIELSNVRNDPLLEQQWHLRNTSQQNFKSYIDSDDIKKGEDIKLLPAHQQGLTGEGVLVAVVDSGLELHHEDLRNNVKVGYFQNLLRGATDKHNVSPLSVYGDHGTSVAGIIAAEGWNDKGGRGVAPKAEIFGINVMAKNVDGDQFSSDKYIENKGLFELGLKNENGELLFEASDNIAVFNRSYGVNPLRFLGYKDIAEFEDNEFRQGAISGYRSGRGALSVVSAGNEFDDTAGQLDEFCQAGGAKKSSLTCYNANMDGNAAQNSVYSVSVASVNALGTHASYSSAGANLFVSAPGGSAYPDGQQIITTDTTGCDKGYSGLAMFEKRKNEWEKYEAYIKYFYAFDYTDGATSHPQNPQCNYTAIFTGTSAAAPIVSGVIALMVEANPYLTWRDIKHILATTSDTVDPQNKSVKLDVDGQEFVAHDGWVKNAAGFSFNNLYGFGRVNAGNAVKAAKDYTSYKEGNIPNTDWIGAGSVVEQARLALSIPDNNIPLCQDSCRLSFS